CARDVGVSSGWNYYFDYW
nr:immunoglobulin heavy chain junction region [Macaca mulatta]MPN69666.1 immunoglobulin heavy chain junction region [Macaca mulatta]MPN70085.1 immunoglobulin heavy chain junction region [Macaca mulatta]MPN70167.1 immunoglobulin heavy chain junction region [Macaca mulatta]MPN71210.1 immunoglobulin heavy chain junction region [Macaca mulatta]